MSTPPLQPPGNYSYGVTSWTQRADGTIVKQYGYNLIGYSNPTEEISNDDFMRMNSAQQVNWLTGGPIGWDNQYFNYGSPAPAIASPAQGRVLAIDDSKSEAGSVHSRGGVANWIDNVNKSRDGGSVSGSVKGVAKSVTDSVKAASAIAASVKAPSVAGSVKTPPAKAASVKAPSVAGSIKPAPVKPASVKAASVKAPSVSGSVCGAPTNVPGQSMRTRGCDLCHNKTQLRIVEGSGERWTMCVKCASKAFAADGIARWRKGTSVQE
jgi:hypothetical protein